MVIRRLRRAQVDLDLRGHANGKVIIVQGIEVVDEEVGCEEAFTGNRNTGGKDFVSLHLVFSVKSRHSVNKISSKT